MFTRRVFLQFGIESIELNGLEQDPKNEEEFNQITYTSNIRISWQQFQTTLESIRNEAAIYQLRMMRNEELKNTDWIMTYDNALTLQNKDEWVTYRKYLRDLPSNVTFAFNEYNTIDIEKMGVFQRPPIIRIQPEQPTT
jgi:hypothetical protein